MIRRHAVPDGTASFCLHVKFGAGKLSSRLLLVYGNDKMGNPPRVVTEHGIVTLSSAQAVGGDRMMFSRERQRRAFAVPASLGIALVLLFGPPAVWAAPAPAPAPSQPGPTLQQVFKQNSPAVVLITQLDAAGKWTSLGSGFVVSPSGVIVTNNHVIAPDAGAVKLIIKLPRGDVYTDVRVIYTEARRDFAVLSIKALGLPTLKVGDSDTVEVGDQIVAIGNPQGLELTFTSGIVESVRLDPSQGYRFIQHQAPISHGSSGGPLLNIKGEVIGINTFTIKDAQNLNGAIPINYVKPYFVDAPTVTWEEFARKSAAAPPVQAPPSAAAPPPSPPPPPAGGATSSPGTFFGSVSFYRPQDEAFRNGFAAGLYDAVALFAAAAKGAGKVDNQEVLTLFRCLDGKGDKLSQLRTWVDSALTQTSSENIIVSILVKACQTSFSPGEFLFFAHSVPDFRSSSDTYRRGFAAGVYDVVSLMASAAQGSAGVDGQAVLALVRCLDGKGEKVGEFRTWIDSVVPQGSSDSGAVVSAVVDACQR
jgi:S1-C subfamily serine protease